ncbi:hypothetical protein C817_01896 [Dorea sp. 5-2]|nr:hypothetical protein C817_01896 [Dorea sp. 5-2]
MNALLLNRLRLNALLPNRLRLNALLLNRLLRNKTPITISILTTIHLSNKLQVIMY